MKNIKRNLALFVLPLVASAGIGASFSPPAKAGGVPPEVATAIASSTATVEALSPLALAALAVALVPFGSMLALKFLQMVMARI